MGKLIFVDGFDHYDTAHMLAKWSTSVNCSLLPGAGRIGAALQSGAYLGESRKTFPAIYNDLIIGYAVKWTSLASITPSLAVASGGEYIVGLGVNPLGALVAYTGETIIGGNAMFDARGTIGATSTNGLIVPNVWYYCEYRFNVIAGTFIARLNGVEVLNLTGLTLSGVSQVVAHNGLQLGGSWLIDDLYVLDPSDASGSAPSAFLGDVSVRYSAPVAPGHVSAWAPTPAGDANWQAVAENPPDDDTSFVASAHPTDADSYKLAVPPNLTPGTTVLGVQTLALARKDTAGMRVVAVGLGDGSGEAYGADHSLPDTYGYVGEIYGRNPLTNAAFSLGDLPTLEVAVKVTG